MSTPAQDQIQNPDSLPDGLEEDSPKLFVDENEWHRTQEELAELRGYKKAMQEVEVRLGQQHPEIQQPQAPSPPPKPEFQYHSEEELQRALEDGDLRTYHKLNKHNSDTRLREEIWNLETTKIQPLQQAGSSAISELAGTLARSGMPHLDIPEVRKSYEQKLQQFTANGQLVTPALHKGVYDLAVGENVAKIEAKLQQGLLRQQSESLVNTPNSQGGRRGTETQPKVPAVTEFFDQAAIQRLQQKYPGTSPEQAADREYARHGGFAGFYNKHYGNKEEKK